MEYIFYFFVLYLDQYSTILSNSNQCGKTS